MGTLFEQARRAGPQRSTGGLIQTLLPDNSPIEEWLQKWDRIFILEHSKTRITFLILLELAFFRELIYHNWVSPPHRR